MLTGHTRCVLHEICFHGLSFSIQKRRGYSSPASFLLPCGCLLPPPFIGDALPAAPAPSTVRAVFPLFGISDAKRKRIATGAVHSGSFSRKARTYDEHNGNLSGKRTNLHREDNKDDQNSHEHCKGHRARRRHRRRSQRRRKLYVHLVETTFDEARNAQSRRPYRLPDGRRQLYVLQMTGSRGAVHCRAPTVRRRQDASVLRFVSV